MPARDPKPFVVPVFIPHSGCAHRCTFCNQHTVTGQNTPIPETADLDATVRKYLEYRHPGRGFTEISFYGGNFLGLETARIRKLLEAATAWVRAGRVHGIRFSTRPDTIDARRLDLLAAYPVSTVEIGVQSTDDAVLERIKRGHSAADCFRAAQMLRNGGFRLGCQIMTGLPGEDENSAVGSAKAVAEMKPDFVRIYPLVVVSGSVLAAENQTGRFAPLDLEACIRRMAKLYRIFSEKGIPVVRMGLQASEELNAPGAVLAGPYHPAMGHMVLSRIMLEHARQRLDAAGELPAAVTLRVHPANISRMRGLKNTNMDALKRLYPEVRQFDVRPDPQLAEDEVLVAAAGFKSGPAGLKTAGTRKALPGT
ncbi:MAG: radical SAM protein [Desulfobacteraceae bacterium]|nr:radical SAM protein [Desulfobacteraceae bacterium]